MTPTPQPWDDDPVTDAPEFRSPYDGEGIWFKDDQGLPSHRLDLSAGFSDHLETAYATIRRSQDKAYASYKLAEAERWQVWPEEGIFQFRWDSGKVCQGPYGVVGSWNDRTHSWFWAWGMPDDWLWPAERGAFDTLKARAETEGHWAALDHRYLYVNEALAWRLTSLAAWTNGMQTTYRAKVNEQNWQYYAIGPLQWVT